MNILPKANKLYIEKNYKDALHYYQEFEKSYPALASLIHANIILCNKKISPHQVTSKNPLISVIVPTHNVGRYIGKCLDSIRSQALKNIEIIIVDDGSNDNTHQEIIQHAKDDDRIIYIRNTSKSSGNSGTPRNQALARARGEYISFVDSDDWIDPDMLQDLYNKAIETKADIVSSGGFYREQPDGSTETVQTSNNFYDPDHQNDRKHLFLSPHFPIVWFRIYKRKLIQQNHITFAETKTSADLPFAFKALFSANKIASIPGIYYHYRFDRPGSTIDRRKGKAAFEVIHSYNSIVRFLNKRSAYQEYIAHVLLKAVGDYVYNLKFLTGDLKDSFSSIIGKFVSDHFDSINDLSIFSKYWLGVINSLKNKEPQITGALAAIDTTEAVTPPAVSVIVPTHNTENHIDRCISSVRNQTLENIEIIIINDGSTDKTLSIIENHASQDSRIKLINCITPSGNPGTPRNIGLCTARGEYIGFVDSDDWIEQDMFESLYNKANSSDSEIVSASAFFRHELEITKKLSINYITNNESDKKAIFKSGYFSNVWNRIYKNSLIKDNNIYFPSIYLSEDLCFSLACHAFSKRNSKSEGCYYHYQYDIPNSTTSLRKTEKGFAIIDSIDEINKYFKSFGIEKDLATQINYKKLNSLWYTYDRLNEEHKESFLAEIRKIYSKLDKSQIDKNLFSPNEIQRLNLLQEIA